MSDIPNDYAARIRSFREHQGLTQTQFGERVGACFQTVNRWENRHHKPSRMAWKSLMALGIEGNESDGSSDRYPDAREGLNQ